MADLTEPAVWVRGVLATRLQILSYLKLHPHANSNQKRTFGDLSSVLIFLHLSDDYYYVGRQDTISIKNFFPSRLERLSDLIPMREGLTINY